MEKYRGKSSSYQVHNHDWRRQLLDHDGGVVYLSDKQLLTMKRENWQEVAMLSSNCLGMMLEVNCIKAQQA